MELLCVDVAVQRTSAVVCIVYCDDLKCIVDLHLLVPFSLQHHIHPQPSLSVIEESETQLSFISFNERTKKPFI